MRIAILGINYWPETIGIAPYNASMAEWFAARGWSVEVVSTFSYYPAWRKRPEDLGRLFLREEINGVLVNRCWHYVPARPSALKRIVHEFSYGVSALICLLAMDPPDALIVVSPPLILGGIAWVWAALSARPFVFHVQDLQPDAAVGMGMIKHRGLVRLLYRLEKFSYEASSRVSGISRGMLEAFTAKGVEASKQMLLPNWVSESPIPRDAAARQSFRQRYNIPEGAFLAVYSGNVGKKQGLGILVDAWSQIESRLGGVGGRQIHLLIVGDGAERDELQTRVVNSSLKSVQLLPLLPKEEYRQMLAEADIGFIAQEKGTGQFFFPSKLLSYLQAKLPVVCVADESSEVAKALADGNFGKLIAPGDVAGVASAVLLLASDGAQLADLRENTAWVNQFDKTKILSRLESELRIVSKIAPLVL